MSEHLWSDDRIRKAAYGLGRKLFPRSAGMSSITGGEVSELMAELRNEYEQRIAELEAINADAKARGGE